MMVSKVNHPRMALIHGTNLTIYPNWLVLSVNKNYSVNFMCGFASSLLVSMELLWLFFQLFFFISFVFLCDLDLLQTLNIFLKNTKNYGNCHELRVQALLFLRRLFYWSFLFAAYLSYDFGWLVSGHPGSLPGDTVIAVHYPSLGWWPHGWSAGNYQFGDMGMI